MSAFITLREISVNFETDLRKESTELFSAKIEESFEEVIAKKFRDIKLYSSKLRLLRAKPIASNPQISEQAFNESKTLQDYGEAACLKVLEQQILKHLTQSHAVKSLITTPSASLHPELMERKEKIIACLTEYRQEESQLRHLDSFLREKEEELAAARLQWDSEVGQLREMRGNIDEDSEMEMGPVHLKLRTIVGKMELMRFLISKLVTSRTGSYDWLTDPHKRLGALKMAREVNTLERFVES